MAEYLYHYTTLESFAMILKSKSIKFNPLTNMDDTQEQRTADAINFGKYVFVSSWIDESRESIAMWKMYSNLYNGIRIKLKKNPFKKYIVTKKDVEQKCPNMEIMGESADFIVPLSDFLNEDYLLLNFTHDKVLERVIYTDDVNKISPQILKITNKGMNIAYAEFGKYKNTYWDFQNEVRYILRFAPIGFRKTHLLGNGVTQRYYDILRSGEEFVLKNYFLKLDDDAFSEMEITTSPCFTEGSKAILEALQAQYNNKLRIEQSKLYKCIR